MSGQHAFTDQAAHAQQHSRSAQQLHHLVLRSWGALPRSTCSPSQVIQYHPYCLPTQVFCGNFEYDAPERAIMDLFEKYGPVHRIDMKTGERSGGGGGVARSQEQVALEATRILPS